MAVVSKEDLFALKGKDIGTSEWMLIDQDRHIWAIDNGLCLHAEFKLRTVIWDFAGEPSPAGFDLDAAADELQALLTEMSGLKKPRGFLNRRVRQFLNMKPKQPPKYRILVMMATNMPDALDPALDVRQVVVEPRVAPLDRTRTFRDRLSFARGSRPPRWPRCRRPSRGS